VSSAPTEFDVIIVGAGLSGIGMAHHLQRLCPLGAYTILEPATRSAAPGTCSATRHPLGQRHAHIGL
jgi:cation diffusion facilitator CzcD-associated flavoprotein CzcO